MIFRVSPFRTIAAAGLFAAAAMLSAQATGQNPVPRYQSPMGRPAGPAPSLIPKPTPITPEGTVVEDVIVRVNDQIISRSDVERSEAQLQQDQAQNPTSPEVAAQHRRDMLRDMIDQQLLLSRAKELGLNADADVIRRLDEIRKQNKMDTLEDLEKAARQQGVSFEDFKSQIRNGILTQEVVRDEVGRHLQMTQAAELAYFEAHKNDFQQPEQIRLSEILVPTKGDSPSDAEIAAAQAKADAIAAKLKAGAKFEDVAKAESGGPTAAQGGDLGLFKRGALAQVLEDQTFSLTPGQYTAPIRTRQGFVILKVTAHTAAGVPALKDVEPQVQEAMYMEAMQPALRAYLTKLREEAYIDIRPGFVDSGASPKQTKPVFSAYTPPAPKKKSVSAKKRFDRGTKFSTVSTAAPRPSATATTSDSSAAPAETAAVPTKAAAPAKARKQSRIKPEKVRYGQAPRNSLPPGVEDAAALPAGDTGQAAAPGAAMVTQPSEVTTAGTDVNADPLAAPAPELKKTRYSARAKDLKEVRAAQKATKAHEKALATPTGPSAEEKATSATQAAPLGLNGDTATKKKRVKVKGAPKERLQEKQTDKPATDNTTVPPAASATTPAAPPTK